VEGCVCPGVAVGAPFAGGFAAVLPAVVGGVGGVEGLYGDRVGVDGAVGVR